MPRKRTSPEEIIHKLREAEILIAQGQGLRAIWLLAKLLWAQRTEELLSADLRKLNV